MSVTVGTAFTPIVKLNSGQFLNPINVNGQRYYVFSSSGTLSINVQCDAQVLLVGGGGGGGPWRGGGGGAGCVIAGQGQSLGCGVPLILRRNQQYTIIVGSGGTGSYGNDLYTDSQNGHPSIFSSSTNGILLYAGGGGRGDRYPGNLAGIGGSGGGGCGQGTSPGGKTGTFIINTSTGQNISSDTAKGYQNFGGGGGINNSFNGGGGGAGFIGGNGSVNGNGGNGIMVFSDIDPFNCNSYYGGGGGGSNMAGGLGGYGGGGSCGLFWLSGENAIDGTGGGGGGIDGNQSGAPQSYKAGDGGSGCCIIKIKNIRRR